MCAGVIIHPTSLPGPYGIGEIGSEAHALVDWMASAGLSLWQVQRMPAFILCTYHRPSLVQPYCAPSCNNLRDSCFMSVCLSDDGTLQQVQHLRISMYYKQKLAVH